MSAIDPGTDEPAQEAADHVEGELYKQDQDEAEEEEHDYLDPSRWWFASTASPLVAGTFGPMANAFSICALVAKWRVHIPSGADEGHGTSIEDPHWLIAINAISLVLALVANMALLLNMARRLSFAVAQPITIIGFYLAGILLVVLVSLASTSMFRLQPMSEHALTQAYYYGIIAAGLYFIIASMMVATVVGAHQGHYPKEFRLTPSQRTLMLQTIGFMIYLLLGALVFSKIEGWQFLDGVFWADFTLLTVGIGGEFVPKTHTGRGLLFPYAIGGIMMVGLVVGSVRSLVLERGKQKLSARMLETHRQRIVSSIDQEKNTIKPGRFRRIQFAQEGISESQKRKQEFDVMRTVQQRAERQRRYTALATSSFAALLLWFFGALVFMYSEKPQGWSYFVSLYFAYTSLLTIGYGDFVPTSNAGKAFFVFWSLLAVPTLTILISNMGDTIIKAFKDATIWLGSLTVFPDKEGVGTSLKIGLKRLREGKIYEARDKEKTDAAAGEQANLDRLGMHIEEEELQEAEEAAEEGDTLERDIHFYHYVLAKEISQLMKDVNASPPKKYSYQDWWYYLRLIGQDEADHKQHREPLKDHNRSKGHGPDLGTADGGEGDGDQKWSWLGVRSPLMGSTTEAQWLLNRLTATLELELSQMRVPKAKRRKDPPPITMSDLKTRSSGSESSSGPEKGPEKEMGREMGAARARRRQKHDD